MKLLLLILAFLVISYSSFSQTGLFRTYEDYQNNNIEKVNSMSHVSYSGGRYRMHYKDSTGKKDKLKYSDVWGFMYEGHLFRSETRAEGFVRVITQGKLIYYENAYFHLEALVEKKSIIQLSSMTSSSIMMSYISTDLNSEIVIIPSLSIGVYQKAWKRFIKDNPKADDFFSCVGKKTNYFNLRSCAASKLVN